MHDWPDRHASTPSELQERLAAERSQAPFVELRDGDGIQRLVSLSDGGVTVGRSPASGLALVWDAQVSRSHASLECIDGVWTVLDDGRSTNGTFVNEERVQNRRTLRHLDVIRVGATRLRFHDPSATTDSKLTEVASQAVVPTLTPAQLRVLIALCRPAGRARLQRGDRRRADGLDRHRQDPHARALRRVQPAGLGAVSQALRARSRLVSPSTPGPRRRRPRLARSWRIARRFSL